MGLTHSGAVAQVFTYRFDQLALARYQGADALAVYSLAIAAMEFAQAGAVVAAQRVLGDHDEGAQARLRKALGRALTWASRWVAWLWPGCRRLAWWPLLTRVPSCSGRFCSCARWRWWRARF